MKHEIDTKKSTLTWYATKVSGKHHGSVAIASGYIEIDKDGLLSGGECIMDMPTITVLDDMTGPMKNMLTNHLKSDDFFSVETFPTSTLTIKQVSTKASGVDITADLTIRGKTNEITFPATIAAEGSVWRAKAEIEIDRLRWDIKFRSGKFFSGLGDALIHDTIRFEVDVVTV